MHALSDLQTGRGFQSNIMMQDGSYHCNLYLPIHHCTRMGHLLGAASQHRLKGNRTLERLWVAEVQGTMSW